MKRAASLFRIIKHQGGSDNHNCQATDLHPTPSPHAFLGKCHFTFPSGFKFQPVHRDNLWILTLRVYRQHSPPTSPRLSLFLTPLSPLQLHPQLSLSHPFPSLTSFSSLLFPACQDDFRLVASGLTQCGTIEAVITTVSEQLFLPRKTLLPIIHRLNPALHADMQGPDNSLCRKPLTHN